MVKARRILMAAVFLLAGLCLSAAPSSAQDQIRQADTIKQYIDASSLDIDIEKILVDKTTGEAAGMPFKEIFGTDFPGKDDIRDTIEDTGEYQVIDESKFCLKAVSRFATRRIVVLAELKSLHGAEEGVSYEGETLLTYATEEEAKEGYENLTSLFGEENVFIDIPIITNAKGWGTSRMNLDKQSLITTARTDNTLTVAVLDTGANLRHSAFSGKTISGKSYNIVSGNSNINDYHGHGTMTAGIIAESTPDNVRIMVLKVINDGGVGSAIITTQAIKYAAENGADIINCSLGGEGDVSAYMDRFMKDAENKGSIIISAAGNSGEDLDQITFYPGESPYSMCISAINKNNTRTHFSNYGKSVDFCAPGQNITAPHNKSNEGYAVGLYGTSFACSYITACTALLRLERPALTRTQAIQELAKISEDLGAAGKDRYYGYGLPVFPVTHGYSSRSASSAYKAASAKRAPGKVRVSSVKWKKAKKKLRAKAVWTSVAGATNYQVKIISKKKKKGGVKEFKTVTVKGTSYTHARKYTKKQKKNSTVKIRIRARNAAGYGPWSQEAVFR